jgi:uncharacterized RDD family membrane protein YckC
MELFRKIKRKTPESVEIEFLLAGIGSRTYALIVDYTVLALGLSLLLLLVSFLAGFIVAVISKALDSTQLGQWLIAIALVTGFGFYVGYFVLFEATQNGQTPGKKLAKIQVVRDDGRPVGFIQAVLRSLVRPIDDLLWVGFFFIVFGQQEKRIGDWLAGTLVVQTQSEQSAQASGISDRATKLAPELATTLNLELLLADDFAVLREYLGRRSTMRAEAENQLATKLAAEFCAILSLDQIPDQVSPQVFLESIYLAYQAESDRR